MISLILAQKKMLKLITFDLDDTLWDVRPTLINAEKKTREFIESKLGKLEWGSWEEFKEIRKNLIKTDASYEYDVGKLRKKLLLMKIEEKLGATEEAKKLAENAFEIFYIERNKVNFFKGVIEALSELASEFKLASLTNGNACIKTIGLDNIFEFNVSSVDVKSNKPNSSHFEKALQLTGFTKNEMLHIGDHQVNDMLAAHNFGVKHLWFNPDNLDWEVDCMPLPTAFSEWPSLVKEISKLQFT